MTRKRTETLQFITVWITYVLVLLGFFGKFLCKWNFSARLWKLVCVYSQKWIQQQTNVYFSSKKIGM